MKKRNFVHINSFNMKTYSCEEIKNKINKAGSKREPFYFVTDFSLKTNLFIPENELDSSPVQFGFNTIPKKIDSIPNISIHPVEKNKYTEGFNFVISEINKGNSFLLNFTQPSKIDIPLSLFEIYEYTEARYKLLYEDKFVVFSPEPFIKIIDGKIYTYPMKGTMNAQISGAKEILMNSEKESAEHATIVDLLRNDMSFHAINVKVNRFKYLELIKTKKNDIWQMSSEISGDLHEDYHNNLGNIIMDMLPAGSITGAPKNKTLNIIKKAEMYDRGYYSGVAGYYDGKNLDTFVLIRFIEKTDQGYIYKSGGGITHMSQLDEEYKELVDKIYVPFY